MIREALSSIARNESLGGLISRTPVARDVVKRVVGGDTLESALDVARELADRGYWVSLERAAPAASTPESAAALADEYGLLVTSVAEAGLGAACEVAVLPEVIGDPSVAGSGFVRLSALAGAARDAGVALMLGNGPTTDVDAGVISAADLAGAGLPVGITLPASRRRSEADCRRLASSRVRLVKGGRGGDRPSTYAQPIEIDKAFVRCAKELLRGSGDASFATHDPRLLEIVETLAARYDRPAQTYEFTFFMGRQSGAQERLLEAGHRVRIYIPYGPEWFERLVGGLAEQSSTISAAVRSLLPGSA